ncbi:hypothetical protein FS799_16000 [Agrobacterium vitis]|uniref:hypothetical protein n=1 Tax=Agrobacterium vitis TaxID=373 RepID=UPI001F1C961E|nr:hypothetical protein [Agrobacterium vitis]MCE6076373.1 hypothetical protein [Agrobacterium vitis]
MALYDFSAWPRRSFEIRSLSNGYAVKVERDTNGLEYVAGIKRFEQDKNHRRHIPLVATSAQIFQGSFLERVIGSARGRPSRDFHKTLARIEALPTPTPGPRVQSWGSHPERVIRSVVEVLYENGTRAQRESALRWLDMSVADLFDAFRALRDKHWYDDPHLSIDPKWMAQRGIIFSVRREFEEFSARYVNSELEMADVALVSAAEHYVSQRIERDLGIHDYDWKNGQDLTKLIHQPPTRQARLKVAHYLALPYLGDLPTGAVHNAASHWSGPSAKHSNLFACPEARERNPDDWQNMLCLARACWSNRTLLPITVWHGFGNAPHLRYAKLTAGEELKPHLSFTATSLSSAVALYHGHQLYSPSYIARIRLPVGFPALFIGGWEHEILLPPGTRFIFTGNMSQVCWPDCYDDDRHATILDVEAKLPHPSSLNGDDFIRKLCS